MYTRAIVRTPCKNFIYGITQSKLGAPVYERALEQHSSYVQALQICGLTLKILEADENFPDSTFVEDTALLTPGCAIITNPGAPARKGEIIEMNSIIKMFYDNIEYIKNPGTVDAGDILEVESHYFIGISERTNSTGADQLIQILKKYGYSASKIFIKKMLHLKSGISYLGDNTILVNNELADQPEFSDFNRIITDDKESYSANCIRVNDYILFAAGFPKTKSKIEGKKFKVIELDVSEFRKLDGGLSCLSLRF